MKKILPELFIGLDLSKFQCETCIKAKSHLVPYNTSLNQCGKHFELVHSDVWSPFPVESVHGSRYFVLFVDDCTRMTWTYLLKKKDEVKVVFRAFYEMVQNQFETNVKFLRSDNGGEFVNSNLREFFIEKGVIHETTCVGTPQQNGMTERKNMHVLETSRALFLEN